MGKLIVTEFITLDGVVEDPGTGDWHFQFFSDEAGKYKFDELMECDAQLLGRVTYEGFAQARPSVEDEAGFAEKMNTMPKFVVSSTLKDPSYRHGRTASVRCAAGLAAAHLRNREPRRRRPHPPGPADRGAQAASSAMRTLTAAGVGGIK